MLIHAAYNADTLTVYQAYHARIAQPAVAQQSLALPHFKADRMTWIKPSFLWMMYRSGWASKENQEHILAITLKRAGLDWALQHASLSHFDATAHATEAAWKEALHAAPVRVQWDPDRDLLLQPLPRRAIQIGLSGSAVGLFLHDWIVALQDVTPLAQQIHHLVEAGHLSQAQQLLPLETAYPSDEQPALRLEKWPA
jgi:hypothetical protein